MRMKMSTPTEASVLRAAYQVKDSSAKKARRHQPQLDREYIVPTLLKSLQVLELLKSAPEGLRIEHIHKQTGISKTTVYRIVRTFVVSGYLRHSGSGAYSPSRGPSTIQEEGSLVGNALPAADGKDHPARAL